MTETQADPTYLAARRTLLQALEALAPQREALIVTGAQAVYLHTGPVDLPVAEFTSDGDIAVDPALLVDAPSLAELMEGADFKLMSRGGAAEPGIWELPVTIDGVEVPVAVDLLVPAGVASPVGRRGARLGPHGSVAARKLIGLEAALVDNAPMRVATLDPSDERAVTVRVAGVAALLVAKIHKLGDRVAHGQDHRLKNKDALDVLRLMQTSSPQAMAATLSSLSADAIAGKPTETAIGLFDSMFGGRAGAGIEMAARAVRPGMPEERVQAICLDFASELREVLRRPR